MFRRILYCIFISVVGECFSTGRKWKGVLLLISFAALPLFALITYTMLSGFFDIKVRTYFFSFVFIVYFISAGLHCSYLMSRSEWVPARFCGQALGLIGIIAVAYSLFHFTSATQAHCTGFHAHSFSC